MPENMPEVGNVVNVLLLCEQDTIILKPGVLYSFTVDEDCENCQRLAKLLKD